MAKLDEQTWRRHVRAWKASGLTCKAYAARVGLKGTTLQWWHWQLGKRDGARARPRRRARSPVTFVELAGVAPATEPFEVELASRLRLRVPSAFDADALKRLLDVLEQRG